MTHSRWAVLLLLTRVLLIVALAASIAIAWEGGSVPWLVIGFALFVLGLLIGDSLHADRRSIWRRGVPDHPRRRVGDAPVRADEIDVEASPDWK